ncbi:hypothetical protein, partial [Neisseria sicca]|uniref:hypothetical protein n=1 Tax=Neisseria sicca TaxID=490 RepID=UPI001C99B922
MLGQASAFTGVTGLGLEVVFGVFVKVGGWGVERKEEMMGWFVTSRFGWLNDELEGLFVGVEIRWETGLIGKSSRETFVVREFFEWV